MTFIEFIALPKWIFITIYMYVLIVFVLPNKRLVTIHEIFGCQKYSGSVQPDVNKTGK